MRQSHKQPAISVTALIFAILILSGTLPAVSINTEFVSVKVLNHFYDVCADEKYAYCTTSFGLAIMKIYDPKYPNATSSLYLKDSAYQVQNSGNYVYVANGNEGLKVIDVFDKYRPEVAGTCSTPGKVRAICMKDSLVYLGEDNSGIQIISIADPENPYIVGSYNSPNSSFFAHNMVLKGSLIYAATESDCIEIINVINPAAPVYAGNFCGATKPMSLVIAGDTMFVGDDAGDCLKIFHLSDPVNPEFIGSAPSNSSKPYQTVYGDGLVYMADYDGITAFDVTDPANPVLSGEYVTDYVGPGRLFLAREYLYYTIQTYGLHIVTIKPPLTQKGWYVTPYYFNEIDLLDSIAFLNINYYGIMTADISDPAQPTWVGYAPVQFYRAFGDICYHDGYIYYANESFYIFDAGDPFNPILIKIFTERTEDGMWPLVATGVIACDNRLYLNRGNHVDVYDITDPPNAFVVDSFGTDIHDMYIDTVRDLLYLSCLYQSHLRIYDISDPSQITYLAGHTFETPTHKMGHLLAEGNLLYFTDLGLVNIFDVSDPADPQLVNDYLVLPNGPYGNFCFDVIAEDTILYVSGYWNINVYNVADPVHPIFLTKTECPYGQQAVEMYKRGDYIYIAGMTYFAILQITFDNISGVQLCGDANLDGMTNLTDVTMMINFLYSKDVSPINAETADFDNSGVINLLDITRLIRYLFKDGPKPECGL